MAKKKSDNAKRFKEYVDDYLEERMGHTEDDAIVEEEVEAPMPIVNQLAVEGFVGEWQPADDEREKGVRAFTMGELREVMQIYRTFDSKAPDPLPHYINELGVHGFCLQMGFCGELVILARRRHRGSALITAAD